MKRNSRSPDEEFESILDAAQRGESWAFEELYRSFRGRLGAFVAARGVEDPDDLVSEVFLGAFRSLSSFRGDETAFQAWMFRIARNKVTDWYRLQGRRPSTVSFPEGFDAAGGDVVDDAEANLDRRELVRLFGTLSHDQAEVLLLRLVGDLTVRQVATVMGRSSGAIKAHQRRALARLRVLLAEPSEQHVYPLDVLERSHD